MLKLLPEHHVFKRRCQHLDVHVLGTEGLLLIPDLVKQGAADSAGTEGKDFHRLGRVEEEEVGGFYRQVSPLPPYHGGDGALAGALGNGKDIDVPAGQGIEELTGNAPVFLHAVAHDADNGAVFPHFNGIDDAVPDFQVEFRGQHVLDRGGLALAHTECNGVFRRRLGNQEQGNAGPADGSKNPACGAGAALHAAAAYTHHGDVLQAGDAPDGTGSLLALERSLADAGTPGGRIVAVQAPGLDALGGKGGQGFGMQDLASEEGKLHGFLVGHILHQDGVGHDAGVCCIDAVHVRPEFGPAGVQAGSDNEAAELAEKLSAEDLLPIVFGLIAGLVIAYLISPIINGIQALQAFNLNVVLTVLLYLLFGSLGVGVARRFTPDIRGTLPSAQNKEPLTAKRKSKNRSLAAPKILDTSVIIDGRIVDILKTGFIEGDIVIPSFVLVELRHIADSSDSLKRQRGRRGLDILNRIQTEYGIEIYETGSDKSLEEIPEVDVKLLKLAQNMKGMVVTNDFNLNKVAAIQGVGVLNINELANTLKPVVLPGEKLQVFLVKEGKENSQGVAYLDDGTMIVVENGKRLIGQTVNTIVTSVLQTSAGRMIFAKPE